MPIATVREAGTNVILVQQATFQRIPCVGEFLFVNGARARVVDVLHTQAGATFTATIDVQRA